MTLIRSTPVSATTRIPFAILQCQSACALKLPARTLDLRQGDIVLLRASQGAELLPIAGQSLAVRVFQLALAKDSDFGPNELIASMLATSEDAHIVFRRINHELCDGYCAQLVNLEKKRHHRMRSWPMRKAHFATCCSRNCHGPISTR